MHIYFVPKGGDGNVTLCTLLNTPQKEASVVCTEKVEGHSFMEMDSIRTGTRKESFPPVSGSGESGRVVKAHNQGDFLFQITSALGNRSMEGEYSCDTWAKANYMKLRPEDRGPSVPADQEYQYYHGLQTSKSVPLNYVQTKCDDTTIIDPKQTSYRGPVTTTEDGQLCIDWEDARAADRNIGVDWSQVSSAKSGLTGSECRNPTPELTDRTWCFTDDSWNYCDICDPTECLPSVDPKGFNYTGSVRTTKDGSVCDNWKDSPDPNLGLKNNFCRNPDKAERWPWCWTLQDPAAEYDFNYCEVPKCEKK